MSESRVRALALALVAAAGIFCGLRLELTGSITHFLPSGEGAGPGEVAELAGLSRRLMESELSRSMVLRVSGAPSAPAAARALADVLAAREDVAWAEVDGTPSDPEAFYRLYFARRIELASDAPEREVPALFEDAELSARARALRRRLAGPGSPLVARSAPADPLGLFEELLERARLSRPGSGDAPDAAAGHVFLQTRASPFDAEAQEPLLAAIEAAFARLRPTYDGELVLEAAGVNRIALASEKSIRRDVSFISIVSVLGVAALFFAVFRSPRALGLALLPPAAGVAVSAAVGAAAFSPVHGVTLAFGLALVGVAIDYPIHLMNHHALAGTRGSRPVGERVSPRATAARVRPSLLMGGLTTALGFGVLTLADFPGVDAMGAFASLGVISALAFTLLALPAFLEAAPADPPAFPLRAARALGGLARRLASRPVRAALLPGLLLLVAAAGLPRLRWQDDPAYLTTPDPALLAEDQRVRAAAADVEPGRFVVALADDAEGALRRNDRVAERLRAAVADGHLEGARSLHALLFSEDLQRRNRAAFRAVSDAGLRIDTAFAREGFRPGAFAPFADELAAPGPAPLRPADLVGTPFERVLDATLVTLGSRSAAITYLRGVHSPEGIEAALVGLEGVHYFDQASLLRGIYRDYRRSTLQLVVFGGVLVFVALLARYRRGGAALAAFLPSALVALAVLGLFGLCGVPVNLLAVVSLVLVMGMGVDYGVFMVDAARDTARLDATLLGLAVSCLTTIFVFGTLALSEHPALRAIGATTGLGIALAFAVSPGVLALAGGRR